MELREEVEESVKQELYKLIATNSYMDYLHIEIEEMKKGYVKSRMKLDDRVLNPYSSVHGGVLYSLADITAGLAACTYGIYSSTVEGNIRYILPAMDTEYIICEAKEVRQGKRISLYDAYLYDDKDNLLEQAHFTFYMMNRPVAK